MTTKEYLNQISRMNRKIKNRLAELAEYKELTYGITAIRYDDKVQTSYSEGDSIGGALAKIERMEKELNNSIGKYMSLKNKIVAQIESIENEIYFQILFSRYVDRKKFEEIAYEMTYSYRHVERLHGSALSEFERLFGEEYLNIKNVS